jgi:acid phosphatase family membrane protein YuiD
LTGRQRGRGDRKCGFLMGGCDMEEVGKKTGFGHKFKKNVWGAHLGIMIQYLVNNLING